MNGIKVRINQSHLLDFFLYCCGFFFSLMNINRERVRERARPHYTVLMICFCHNRERTRLLMSVVHMHVHKTGCVVFPLRVRLR